ncbi:MAG: trehalose-phosphatase [Proteobacteria bacterium]|nr:MAG: trehalose-phosphatase [Pseudomonadota bacterium]
MAQRLGGHFADFNLFQAQYLSGRVALFLDVDGTLLEIARRPDAVRVTEPLKALLGSLLTDNRGAVALVSGRTLDGLDALFAPPAFPAAGLHGVERRSASGIIHRRDFGAALHPVREMLSAHSCDGLLVEDKGGAIVLHYREHPELEDRALRLAEQAVRLAGAAWSVVPGKMSFELRVAHVGKHQALEDFMNEPPFAGRIPAFFGDDVTDEPGFEYVNAHDGWSVHIGSGPSAARRSLPDPLAVWRLLRALHPHHAHEVSAT